MKKKIEINSKRRYLANSDMTQNHRIHSPACRSAVARNAVIHHPSAKSKESNEQRMQKKRPVRASDAGWAIIGPHKKAKQSKAKSTLCFLRSFSLLIRSVVRKRRHSNVIRIPFGGTNFEVHVWRVHFNARPRRCDPLVCEHVLCTAATIFWCLTFHNHMRMINWHRNVVEISFRFSHLLILFSPKAYEVAQLDIDVIDQKRENHFVGHVGQRTQQMRMKKKTVDHRHFYVTDSGSVRVFKCPPARPRIICANADSSDSDADSSNNSDSSGLIGVQRILIPTPCFDRDLRFIFSFLVSRLTNFSRLQPSLTAQFHSTSRDMKLKTKKVVSSLSIASE